MGEYLRKASSEGSSRFFVPYTGFMTHVRRVVMMREIERTEENGSGTERFFVNEGLEFNTSVS